METAFESGTFHKISQVFITRTSTGILQSSFQIWKLNIKGTNLFQMLIYM